MLMKSAPAELAKPLTVEDVRRIFGFTKPEDLSELLKKCPRHYIRVRPIGGHKDLASMHSRMDKPFPQASHHATSLVTLSSCYKDRVNSPNAVQSYYAQIYLGSPQNTNDIRSNNDGYLRNQIIRGESPCLRYLGSL